MELCEKVGSEHEPSFLMGVSCAMIGNYRPLESILVFPNGQILGIERIRSYLLKLERSSISCLKVMAEAEPVDPLVGVLNMP